MTDQEYERHLEREHIQHVAFQRGTSYEEAKAFLEHQEQIYRNLISARGNPEAPQ